jgi:hypothetical protein
VDNLREGATDRLQSNRRDDLRNVLIRMLDFQPRRVLAANLSAPSKKEEASHCQERGHDQGKQGEPCESPVEMPNFIRPHP